MALFSALFCLSLSASKAQVLDPGAIYNTGNLVLPTPYGGPTPWVNGVYQDSLTCWAWGNPGYCGPNPIVRPGNDINFSFGWTDLYQQQNIGSLLPNSGTGLQVNGYNFSFAAKNGNGWDDGRTDLLFAYVQFNNPTGGTLLNHTHNLSTNFNWTNFTYNQTFNTPYKVGEIGSVRYGFVGQDNNFWAGPYGPEISNVSFSLKYSLDPCSVNTLSSPSCPGYLDALRRITPTPVVSNEPTIVNEPVVVSTILTTASSTSTPQETSTQVTTTPVQEDRTRTGPTTSQLLSIIRNNQANVASIERAAVERAVNEAELSSQASREEASNFIGINLLRSSAFNFGRRDEAGKSGTEGEVISNNSVNLVGRNPINDYLEQKQNLDDQSNNSQPGPAVRRNVPNNEAAGGVDIAMLQKVPTGFDLYLAGLADNKFYPDKEIYRNQNVVDNVRILRQLNNRSDSLHREMVDEQYRK